MRLHTLLTRNMGPFLAKMGFHCQQIFSTAETAVPANVCDQPIQVHCDTNSTRLNPSKREE